MNFILLFTIIVLANATHGKDPDCPHQREVTNQEFFTLPSPSENSKISHQQDHRVCLRPTDPSSVSRSKITLDFGEIDTSSNFQVDFQMQLLGRNKHVQYIFQQLAADQRNEKDIDGRIPPEWFSPANWTCFILASDKITFLFGKDDQTLDIQLGGIQVESVKEVRIITNINIMASANCTSPEESVETLQTTTTIYPTTTITTIPVVSLDHTSSMSDLQNSTETIFSGTENDSSTTDPSADVVPVAVQEEGVYDGNCNRIPMWAWVCVGLMGAFIFFFFVLLVYTIILIRRTRSLQAYAPKHGDYIRGGFSPPGGLGHQVRDLQYFKTENQSVVAIAPHPTSSQNTQTMRLPPLKQVTPDVSFYTSPRVSEYRRSVSCPTGHQEPFPLLNFPAPPSTPPPVARPETVPLFCPNGSSDGVDNAFKRGISSTKRSSSKRQRQRAQGIDADDESSSST